MSRGVARIGFAVLLASISCVSPPEEPPYLPPDTGPPSTEGWIVIDDAKGLETRCPSLHVEGWAILSAAGEVTVSWQNLTTGESGVAETTAGYDYVTWSAEVPVAPGANELRFTRLCPVGIPAEDSTLGQRLPGAVVSGLLKSSEGMPLRGVLMEAVGPVEEASYTGSDGRYALCLPEGDYSLMVTPACPYDPPAPRSIAVAGAAMTVPDIVWSYPYFAIFGEVWPAVQATVEASDTPDFARSVATRSNLLGYYLLCVSPGTWNVRVVGEPWQSFLPPVATVEVVNGDEPLWFLLDWR